MNFCNRIFLFILITKLTFAVIIPEERRIDWKPGMPDVFPEKSFVIDVKEKGAIGDGLSDDSQAFINALQAIPSSGGILHIPEGIYLIKRTLSTEKSVVFRGEGYDKTKLLFDLNQQAQDCIDILTYKRGDWINVLNGYAKGSNKCVVANPAKFKKGDFVEIQQDNDADLMYTQEDWKQSWSENAVGQLLKVEDVVDDTLILHRPFYYTYRAELNPVIRTLGMVEYPGVENLYIERLDAGDGYTIQMRYVAYGRIRQIESNFTYRCHVYMSEAYGCEISNNYFHHAHDYGGGGHGYGIDVIRHSTDNLIIDNVFKYLRHSMMTHVGTSGNICAYNFSTEREPQRLCDVSLHGHYSNYNLFESNNVEEIDIADYWGPMGPGNTFLRNKITKEGIDVNDSSHDQNLVGNVLEAGSLTVKSGVTGTLNHGNLVRTKVVWDDAIADQNIPVSYFLSEKPAFLANYPWPIYGPDIQEEVKLPAQVRYEMDYPITKVEQRRNDTPHFYYLQAYPNPFNPQTQIRFKLDKSEYIHIEVYSIDGQQKATLFDEKLAAGLYSIPFALGTFASSGVYLVNLQSESINRTIKVTYLK